MIYILLIIPFLSSCVSDDCSECVDMAYDTRVKLQVTWPSELSPNNSKADAELVIKDFTLFVINADGTLNTMKKVTNPGFAENRPTSVSVNMNITSNAKYIYAIANCSDLLDNSPTSYIATQVNANMSNLQKFFDGTLTTPLSIGYNEIFEGTGIGADTTRLVLTGYTDSIRQSGTNPYNYVATVKLKPIVSKLDIKVTNTGAPTDYTTCIDSITTFILNSRSRAKLFAPSNISFPYLHGDYKDFWEPYGNINFGFSNTSDTSTSLTKKLFVSGGSFPTNTVSIYVPENDTTLGSKHKTLVVLKVWYKMTSIEGSVERFSRYLTVPLNPPTGGNPASTLSNKRGTKYTITFNLSGKYFGAMSPLSSMMQPYSPLPTKTTKNLIYVAPEDYSYIKVTEWK